MCIVLTQVAVVLLCIATSLQLVSTLAGAKRLGPRRYWSISTVENVLFMIAFNLMGPAFPELRWLFLSVCGIFGLLAGFSLRQWVKHKDDDDDDDWGNKLTGWAKNNLLPKPKVTPVRAALRPGS